MAAMGGLRPPHACPGPSRFRFRVAIRNFFLSQPVQVHMRKNTRAVPIILAACSASLSCRSADAGNEARPAITPFATIALADSLSSQDFWPGFNPRSTPVAIFDGTRTLLFRHPAPPPPFTPLADHDSVWVHAGRDSSVSANTSTELGGVTTATLMPAPDSTPALRRAGILVHEAFHVFQRAHHPSWSANEADLFTYPVSNAALLTQRRLESEALRRALLAATRPDAACWARAAVNLRRERFARLPASASAYERGTELNEGLATYVEWRATNAPDTNILPAHEFAPEKIRDRGYRSGVALARLLDRLSPDWRAELEAHDAVPLDSMLTTALARLPGEPCGFTDAERDSIGRVAATDETALAGRLAAERRSFLDRPGWRLIIKAASPLFPQGFDPLNVNVVAPGEVLHSRLVKLGNDAGSVEVIGRPSLSEAAGSHPLFNGVRALTVTGLAELPRVTNADSSISISADGISGTFRGASVDTAGEVITLRLRAAS